MRKLGLFALVLGLIIAFSLPVSAYMADDGKGNKMMIGGTWMTDFGYWNRSSERMTSVNPAYTGSNTQFMLNVPGHSNFRGFVESGNTGGFWELGLGTGYGQVTGVESSYITIRKIYGYYKFGYCEIRVGKDDGWIWSLVPMQRLGANLMTVWAFGFGSFYDGRFTQVRFTQNISQEFRYAISLVANQNISETMAGTARTSYAQIPTLAAKFTLNFGAVTLFPAFAWSQVKWNNVPSGWDDNVVAYYAVLPVRVVAGPFTGLFQAGYGQNIGNLLESVSANTYQVYQRLANGSVKNTTQLNGFVDLSVTFGPVTPHLMFGYDNASNTDAWKAGDDHNTRVWWGLSLNYQITPAFMVVPEFSMFDFGNKPGVAGSPYIGRSWMAGLQFVFAF